MPFKRFKIEELPKVKIQNNKINELLKIYILVNNTSTALGSFLFHDKLSSYYGKLHLILINMLLSNNFNFTNHPTIELIIKKATKLGIDFDFIENNEVEALANEVAEA